MKKWWIFALGMAAVSSWLLPGTIRAHGEPVITVSPVSVPAGGEVLVTGTEMEEGELFAITLEGITLSVPLGEAPVAGEGFEVTLTIPADTPPGSYRVQAAAGEETAVADITITAPVDRPADDQLASAAEPSAAPMDLDRPQSAARTIAIVAMGLLSLGLGLWLVRR